MAQSTEVLAAEREVPGDRSDDADAAWLAPLFLGPCGENGARVETLLVALLRDHVHWRRNFHPEDPPSITAAVRRREDFADATARLEQALFDLGRRLKKSAPTFSPRYIGHMTSDPLLPALLGQLATTLYNPNNVAIAGGPVTLGLELEVGQQLAAMLGMELDPAAGPRACGHLTSGGTMANYEALWLLRSARLYPPALAAGLRAREAGRELGLRAPLPGRPLLADADPWTLVNLSVRQACDLYSELTSAVASLPAERRALLLRAIAEERHDHLGSGYFERHALPAPVVIAPATAHYSWSKAMTLLGLGRSRLWLVPTDAQMRMDAGALEAALERALEQRVPVLAVIGVLGTTEFGSIDPIHEILVLRKRFAERGLAFAIHVDAAWGGYLATLFRRKEGGWLSRADVRRWFRYFPTPAVYRAFRAVAQADTVTVDPHKMGYVPVGAGALVMRDHRLTAFVGERPPYLYDDATGTTSDNAAERRMQDLGDYILEGSKPGAAAAAAWLAHQVLPLDARDFGRLCRRTIRANERLFDQLHELAHRLAPVCLLAVPVEPDTNLICLALNPAGNVLLAQANAFTRRIYRRMAIDSSEPVQARQFIASHTAIRRASLGDPAAANLATAIGVSAATFVPSVGDPDAEADHVFLIRHTLMNPWLDSAEEGKSCLERYCEWLEAVIRDESGAVRRERTG